jgi:hypothetical protein
MDLLVDFRTLALGVGAIAVLGSALVYLFSRPAFGKGAPALTQEAFPIIGSLQFFTQRWDWWQKAKAHSGTSNFSFYAGQHPVVAVSSPEAQKVFFEDKRLGFAEGYGALLGGSPTVKRDNEPMGDEGGYNSGEWLGLIYEPHPVSCVLQGCYKSQAR